MDHEIVQTLTIASTFHYILSLAKAYLKLSCFLDSSFLVVKFKPINLNFILNNRKPLSLNVCWREYTRDRESYFPYPTINESETTQNVFLSWLTQGSWCAFQQCNLYTQEPKCTLSLSRYNKSKGEKMLMDVINIFFILRYRANYSCFLKKKNKFSCWEIIFLI